MRISDWSSDVCSSDLGHCGRLYDWFVRSELRHLQLWPLGGMQRVFEPQFEDLRASGASVGERFWAWRWVRSGRSIRSDDRQSVVSGKRVSVRVDFGGSCFFKNK